MSLQVDMANAIDGETLAGVVMAAGTNLFASEILDDEEIPDVAIFMDYAPSFPQENFLDGDARNALSFPTVQVIVRGAPNAAASGLALAEALFERLRLNPPAGCIELTANNSGPSRVSKDDRGRSLFVFSLQGTIHIAP